MQIRRLDQYFLDRKGQHLFNSDTLVQSILFTRDAEHAGSFMIIILHFLRLTAQSNALISSNALIRDFADYRIMISLCDKQFLFASI